MQPTSDLRTSPNKARKPQARTLPLRHAIICVAGDYKRMTIRQLYYQLVSRGVIEKTEQAYKRVCDISAQMRLDGSLPYQKIADGSRARLKPYAFGGLAEALEITSSAYRRNIWIDQPAHVEIWCEKDALTGVIKPICDDYCVTYVATRGFPSLTLLYESAMEMIERGKPTQLYYFGDHDASGQAISTDLEGKMRAHGADVHVHRVGLLAKHIADYQLPTRPSKKSDGRTAKFAAQYGDACVELDALPPQILTSWVQSAIKRNLDQRLWAATLATEKLERETYASLAQVGWKAGHLYEISGGNDDDDEEPEEEPVPTPDPPRVTDLLGIAETMAPSGPTTFSPGQRVRHATFGDGVVVSAKLVSHDGGGVDEEVTVVFTGKGVKRLLASFAKLEVRP